VTQPENVTFKRTLTSSSLFSSQHKSGVLTHSNTLHLPLLALHLSSCKAPLKPFITIRHCPARFLMKPNQNANP